MAKQKIPTTIQNKFRTKLFKQGEYVYINWLGLKEYGFIKRIYKSGDSFSYMVQTHSYVYPCGIQIKNYKSSIAGCILYEQTKEFGSVEIKRRYESGSISQNACGAKPIETSKNTIRGNADSRTSVKVSRPKKPRKHSTENAVESSATRNDSRTTKRTRKSYSKLDQAIQKQRDFLRKFT
jgi:hypothetical protein